MKAPQTVLHQHVQERNREAGAEQHFKLRAAQRTSNSRLLHPQLLMISCALIHSYSLELSGLRIENDKLAKKMYVFGIE